MKWRKVSGVVHERKMPNLLDRKKLQNTDKASAVVWVWEMCNEEKTAVQDEGDRDENVTSGFEESARKDI